MAHQSWSRPAPSADVLGRAGARSAKAALKAHLAVTKAGEPIRAAISQALKEAGGLGGHERRFVAFAARELSRHQRFCDFAARAAGHPPGRWALAEDRVLVRYVLWRRLFTGASWRDVAPEVRLPGPLRPRSVADRVLEAIADHPLPALELPLAPVERAALWHSFPAWLAERLASDAGAERIDALLAALNRDPDIHLRARPPGSRERLLEALAAEGIACEPIAWAPDAVRVTDPGTRVFEAPALKRGAAQAQEAGSQLIAMLCRVDAPSARAADVCAGAGGKTIALADLLGAGAAVYAGDRSARRLAEAKRRTRELRAPGVAFPRPLPIAECDVVLVDAPCSGTGSLGREPDQKWKLTPARVEELAGTQRALLGGIMGELRPGAVLVYSTCSLLREENQAVVEWLLARHPELSLEAAEAVLPDVSSPAIERPWLSVWPDRTGSAGFFAARFRFAPGGKKG